MKILVDADLAETVPDGTFGGSRPRRGEPADPATRIVPSVWTREQQDAHYNALADAVNGRRRDGSRAAHTDPSEVAA